MTTDAVSPKVTAVVRYDRNFRWAAAIFGAAVALHGIDHMRRGMSVVPAAVMYAGMAQLILAAVTIALVFAGNRWVPAAAMFIGFASAIGFTVAHLLPHWGFFSDSFIDAPPTAGVTAFSWVTAIVEIIADTAFGVVGVIVLRERGWKIRR